MIEVLEDEMKTSLMIILTVLALLLFACGSDKEANSQPPKKMEATANTLTTYTFNWNAICRCEGETVTGGKLCQSNGTYTGQDKSEEDAVEKMKGEARIQMKCKEGPFLSFRYETP